MTAQRDPYVKVYYSIVDDPKFADVYDDDAALAAWLRLLLVADGTYPAPAPIPIGTKQRSFDKLVDAGLIDRFPGQRYKVHGLDAERAKRSAQGRAGASARWEQPQSDRNANALVAHSDMNASPLRSTPSNSAPLRSAPVVGSQVEDDSIFNAYYQLTTRPPSKNVIAWLNRLVDDYGVTLVIGALGTEWKASADPATLLGRVQTRLADEALRAGKAAEERRKRAAIEEVQALKDAMPEEARKANLVRLGDMMREKGLI